MAVACAPASCAPPADGVEEDDDEEEDGGAAAGAQAFSSGNATPVATAPARNVRRLTMLDMCRCGFLVVIELAEANAQVA